MFDLMTLEKFVPIDFRPTTKDGEVQVYEKPPTIFYRIPTVMEASAYSAKLARMKDELEIDASDHNKFLHHESAPGFFASESIPYIVRVENVNKDGQPVDWSALSDDAKKDLLMRLGTSAITRFWSLVSLTGAIFSGLTSEEKKS